jgi:hypothetical protein
MRLSFPIAGTASPRERDLLLISHAIAMQVFQISIRQTGRKAGGEKFAMVSKQRRKALEIRNRFSLQFFEFCSLNEISKSSLRGNVVESASQYQILRTLKI